MHPFHLPARAFALAVRILGAIVAVSCGGNSGLMLGFAALSGPVRSVLGAHAKRPAVQFTLPLRVASHDPSHRARRELAP